METVKSLAIRVEDFNFDSHKDFAIPMSMTQGDLPNFPGLRLFVASGEIPAACAEVWRRIYQPGRQQVQAHADQLLLGGKQIQDLPMKF